MGSSAPIAALPKRLQLWLDEALRNVAPQAPQHIHIDQLVAEATGEAALSLASEAYAFVLERMGDTTANIKAALLLPLHDSETLLCQTPSREQLVEELTYGPPSIYLLSREVEKHLGHP